MSSVSFPLKTLELKRNALVFFRIRPELNPEVNHIKLLDDRRHVYVRSLQDFAKGKENKEPNYLVFETDGIFYNASQADVFGGVCMNNLFYRLFQGINAIVLLFGQTGSGKTITTCGLEGTYEDRGILPRILETLFEMKQLYKMTIKLKCLEANRNFIKSLLDDEEIVYDMTNYHHIQSVKVPNLYEGLKLLFEAEVHKTFRNVDNAYKGNIANCVTTFEIYVKHKNNGVTFATLHVVELAGVDTIGNGSCTHKSGHEVGNGNLAKSQIEQLIMILNKDPTQRFTTKQRLCILVHYLKDSINAHSLITVVGHLRMTDDNLRISTSLLRFGCTIRGMLPKKLKGNVEFDPKSGKDELLNLKKEAHLNSMLVNEDLSSTFSKERHEYIRKMALDYLEDKNGELVLLSTTDTVAAMRIIKNIYRNNHAEMRKLYDQIKKKEEDSVTGSTREGSVSSKLAKQRILSNSSVGTKSRKSMSRRLSSGTKKLKSPKNEMASIPEVKEVTSYHSFKSTKTSSKNFAKRSKRSVESLEQATHAASNIPRGIPSFEAARKIFEQEASPECLDILNDISNFEGTLESMTRNYNKQVELLEERTKIKTTRNHELYIATHLNDFQESDAKKVEFYEDIRKICSEKAKQANQDVINQKEHLLKQQAELKLNIEHRERLKDEISKKFDAFCMNRFGVLVPDVQEPILDNATRSLAKIVEEGSSVLLNSVPYQNYENAVLYCQNKGEDAVDQNEVQFKELKKMMEKELSKLARKKKHNRKWINSFGMNCKIMGSLL